VALERCARDAEHATSGTPPKIACELGHDFFDTGSSVALSPATLLAQHALCTEVAQALEQNGNPRLQLERLLLGLRELRASGAAHA